MSWVVSVFDQLYVYDAVPPVTVKSIVPFDPPKQSTFVWVAVRLGGELIVIVPVAVALVYGAFAKVIVTL